LPCRHSGEQLIADAGEAEAPTLRIFAAEILASTARDMCVSLGPADVLLRRARGVPEVHITAAADVLLDHLAAIEGIALDNQGAIMVLAKAGARPLMSRAGLAGNG
jgi:hypothetical protein